MKWSVDFKEQICQISDQLQARIRNDVATVVDQKGNIVWVTVSPTPKAAVAAWIGKTMAQLSNALAAGEIRVDEE